MARGKARTSYVREGDVIVTVPIDPDLHLRLKVHAAKNRTTIKQLLVTAIKEMVK